MTLQFIQPPSLPGQPNLSPFCVKTEIMLTYSGLQYELITSGDPTLGPKKKVPYIIDGDAQPLGDSYFIEKHLSEHYGVDFYKKTTLRERAIAKLLQAAIEEKLYWVLVYSRWQVQENWPIMDELFFGKMPPDMRDNVSKLAHETMLSELWSHGMGRHSQQEVYAVGAEMIESLATVLARTKYFFGNNFTSLDATAYGTLINFVQNPVPTPLKNQIFKTPNLCAFLDQMSEQFFPTLQVSPPKR